jgi:LPS export ABC transporter protein LptC
MWWLFWSTSSLDDEVVGGRIVNQDEITFKDFKLTNPREGWELKSDVCLKNDAKRSTRFDIVEVKSTAEDGTITEIDSTRGSIDEEKKKIDFVQNVAVSQADGYRRIFSDYLVYSYKMKIGSSPGAVRIVEDDSLCSGNSMDFNANSRTGKVVGKVHLVINPEADELASFVPVRKIKGATGEAEKVIENDK